MHPQKGKSTAAYCQVNEYQKHAKFKKKDIKFHIFCILIYLKCYMLCINTNVSTDV